MRIHIQNPPGDPLFQFSKSMWDEAVGRSPDIATGHDLTIGESDAEFVAAMAQAEALITDVGVIRSSFPGAAPNLKMVFVTSAGLDRLAPFDWLPNGVALLNNRGTHDRKVGEFAIMSLIMLANRVPQMVTNQRAARWEKIYGSVLAGRRVTVIGLGTLGGATARHAAAFGMHVTGVRANPAPHPDCTTVIGTSDLDTVLPETEFLVIACPLTEATRGLITRQRLEALPRDAGIVNIGRGEIVDQDALCDLLDASHLSGAVLDVFTPEPLPPDHRVWQTPRLIVTPHTSADDPVTYNPQSLDIFFDNLRALRDGRALPNRFDPVRGY